MIVDFVTRNGKLEAKQLRNPFTDESVESMLLNEEDADAIFELVQEVSRVKWVENFAWLAFRSCRDLMGACEFSSIWQILSRF